MEKYSNGEIRLPLQALFVHVSEDDVYNEMVQQVDEGNVRRVTTMPRIQTASNLQVLGWERKLSGTVVPLCDFHRSSTLTLWITGGLPP